jgi:hypothetical protein
LVEFDTLHWAQRRLGERRAPSVPDHGTWSTLNARLGRSRTGMEGFANTVLRRAVIELEAYSHEAAPADDIDAFLKWLKQRVASSPGQPK